MKTRSIGSWRRKRSSTICRPPFPNLRIEIVRTVVNGDLVAGYCRVTVTHAGDGLGIAATGRTATISGMVMARVENGQIAEGWNCFDFLSLYQQLGLLPALS